MGKHCFTVLCFIWTQFSWRSQKLIDDSSAEYEANWVALNKKKKNGSLCLCFSTQLNCTYPFLVSSFRMNPSLNPRGSRLQFNWIILFVYSRVHSVSFVCICPPIVLRPNIWCVQSIEVDEGEGQVSRIQHNQTWFIVSHSLSSRLGKGGDPLVPLVPCVSNPSLHTINSSLIDCK